MPEGLGPRVVDRLFAAMETPGNRITGALLDDHYHADAHALRGSGFLVPDGHATAIAPLADHDDQLVKLSWSADDAGYGYFEATAGWAAVSADRLARYRIDVPKVIASLMSRISDWKPRQLTELIEDILWEVGDLQLDGRPRRVPVWFARRLSFPLIWQQVKATMALRSAPGLRIILTSTPSSRLRDSVASAHAIVSVLDVLDHQSGLVIDPAILAARVSNPNAATNEIVSHTADFGVVTIRGVQYRFAGSKQRQIMRQLVEAFHDGSLRCLTAKVLEEAECSPSVNTLAKAFSGRPDWRSFATEERGSCWLVV